MTSRLFLRIACALSCTLTMCAQQSQSPVPGQAAASGAAVRSVEVASQADRIVVKVAVSAPVVPRTEQVQNPDRLILDFAGCELRGANRHIPVNRGPIKELRVAQFSVQPPVTRVVVESRAPLKFEVKPAAGGFVEIEIPVTGEAPMVSVSTRPAPGNARDADRGRENTPVERPHPALAATPSAPPTSAPLRVPAKTLRPGSQPGAYALMAKAKALTLAELQPLEEKAASGDPEAQTTLGLAYHSGFLLKKDDKEAVRLLQQAAGRNYVAAEEAMGILSEAGDVDGSAAPQDALRWYAKAAEQGSLDAATNIGLMYINGKGVPRDSEKALLWFLRAAEGGDSSAQYDLALMYERGDGVTQDYNEAVRWLKAAAEQSVIPAILDLGDLALHPQGSLKQDAESAVRYYAKASSLGSSEAEAMLGNIHANGILGKKDYDESVKWYRKAAEVGQPDAQFGLAVRYALGQGVAVDADAARRWFEAAAAQGHDGAQYDVATMYEEGRGIPADREKALHYYQMAAEQGMAKAQYRLGLMLAKGGAASSDRVAACTWLMLAGDAVKESAAALSDVRKTLSAPEIAEAERGVDRWRVAHGGGKK